MWLEIKRIEDCCFEGIPPHSGYRGAALRAIKRLERKIRLTINKGVEENKQDK